MRNEPIFWPEFVACEVHCDAPCTAWLHPSYHTHKIIFRVKGNLNDSILLELIRVSVGDSTQYDAIPDLLDGSPLANHQVSLTIHHYSFTLLNVERLWEKKVSRSLHDEPAKARTETFRLGSSAWNTTLPRLSYNRRVRTKEFRTSLEN